MRCRLDLLTPALPTPVLPTALGLHGLPRHRALQAQDDGLLPQRWRWTSSLAACTLYSARVTLLPWLMRGQ